MLARGVDTALFSPTWRTPWLRHEWGARATAPVCLVVSRLAARQVMEGTLECSACVQSVSHLSWESVFGCYENLLAEVVAPTAAGAGAVLPAPNFR